jgi:hypothetical protein
MSEDYKRGYREGYQDGVKDKVNMPEPRYFQPSTNNKCSVCGMVFKLDTAYGYVCGRQDCPTKVTSTLLTEMKPGSSYLSSLPEITSNNVIKASDSMAG